MKKTLTLFTLIFALFVTTGNAQPSTPIMPDFTLTDMNGDSHNLYTYLDNGKTVILDIFATWCGPCISSLPGLDDIWTQHGPGGDNTMMLLSLEADPATSDEASFISQYNITNPLFNNGHTIANMFNFNAYPTFFVVCPDRTYKMRVGGIGNDGTLLTSLNSDCQGLSANSLDTRILEAPASEFVCGDPTTIAPSVWIQNYASTTLTSFDVVTRMDGNELNTEPWTGTLAPYEAVQVTLPDVVDISAENHTIEFESTNPNGRSEDNMNNSIATTMINALTSKTTVTLDITPDIYGSEITWELNDASGATVYSGGPYTDNNTDPIQENFTLTDLECYEFNIYDTFGDGIFPPGGYWLSDENGQFASGGEYEDDETTLFKADDTPVNTGIDEVLLEESIAVYPNPVEGVANIEFNLSENSDVVVNVYDILGKMVSTQHLGTMVPGGHITNIDFSDMNSGVYVVSIKAGNVTTSKRITAVN